MLMRQLARELLTLNGPPRSLLVAHNSSGFPGDIEQGLY